MTEHHSYRTPAYVLFVAAALYVIAPLFGGGTGMLGLAGLMGLLALALLRGMRWAGYIAFLVTGIAGAVTFGGIFAVGGLPIWWSIAATVTAWAAAVRLLFVLWRPA